jgi:peptidoglycan/LPS O-acetylase OafA/YrhL
VRYPPQLDGLRALAIVMVFLHHAFNIPLLWAGVDLFFILSGYLITNILVRDRETLTFRKMLGKFYLRRAERILPAYTVFLLLVVLLDRRELTHVWPWYVTFLQNIPYAFHLIPFGPLVPLWSLAVEQHFYLVWPVLVYFAPRRWLAPLMVALLLVEPILRALCTPLFTTPEAIYSLTPFRLDAMAVGALAALLLPHCKPRITIRWAQVSMLLGALAYAALSIHPWFRRGANTAAFNALAYSLNLLILGGLFVWTALSRETLLTRLLASPPLRGLGRISYMFYLLHLGVLLLVNRYTGRAPAAAIAFALTTLLATLSWFAIEKPILNLSAAHRRAAPQTPMVSG